MPIKQTVPTNSGDSIQFGNATTPVAASITGAEISTGNGYLALNTANSGTVSEQVRVDKDGNVLLNNATSYLSVGANRSYFGYGSVLVSGGAATDTGILTGGNILFGTNAGAGNTERLRITSTGKIGVGNTNPSTSLDISSKTDALSLPSGTTAQRPSSPPNGSFRYNTTANTWESYNNGGWIPSNPNVVTNYQQFTTSGTFTPASGVRNIQLLVVGGGGGGGTSGAGGGGAGGVVYIPNFAVTPSVGITVTIGSGGAANANGTNSSFGSITAYGGGRGGYLTDVSYGHINAAYSGASGGGSGATSTVVGSAAPASSQGSAGGIAPIASPFPAGGGGGAGQVGQNGASGVNGNGGNGIYIPIFASYGSSGYFGGGGAGGYTGNSSGTGGLGGGGNTATAGTANTGGGGGGGTGSGAAGGSGTVIVAWYQ